MTEADPTLGRLEDQISWYDRKSNYSQQVYKWIKIIEIVAAALVPLAAGLSFLFLPSESPALRMSAG